MTSMIALFVSVGFYVCLRTQRMLSAQESEK